MTQIKPKAFNIYLDTYNHMKLLTMEQRGELFTALYEFAADGVCADFKDGALCMAFSFMRAQIERDFIKYEEKCLRLRENGNKGGRPSKKENQKNQLVFSKTKRTKEEEKEEYKEEEKKEEYKEEEKKEKENAFGGYSSAAASFCSQVIDLFNDNCVSLPRAEGINEDRIMCLQRTRAQFPSLNYAELFDRVERSDFLTGRNGKWNGCTFDWLIRPDTVSKILNGNYDNREETILPPPPEPARHTSYDIRELEKIDTLDWIDV